MTTVHDLRAKFSDDSRVIPSSARDAALRGALSAVKKLNAQAQQPVVIPARKTGAAAAASAAHKPTVHTDHRRPPLLSNNSSQSKVPSSRKSSYGDANPKVDYSRRTSPASRRNRIGSQGSHAILTTSLPERPASRSASNIAAALAAARFSPHGTDRSHVTSPLPSASDRHRQWMSGVYGERRESAPREELPAPESVGSVAKWLQTLDAVDGASTSHLGEENFATCGDPAILSNEWSTTTQDHPQLPAVILRLGTPPYTITPSLDRTIEIRNLAGTEIKSPKPVRAVTAAESIENSVKTDSNHDSLRGRVDRGRDSHTLVSGNLDEAVKKIPHRTFPLLKDGGRNAVGGPLLAGTLDLYRPRTATGIITEPISKAKPLPPLPPPHTSKPLIGDSSRVPLPQTIPSRPNSAFIARSSMTNATMRPTSNQTRQFQVPKRNTQEVDVSRQSSSARRVDSLANAIVASHIAAQRAPLTPQPTAPPLTRRHTEQTSHSHLPFPHFHHAHNKSRTPSPNKTMRHTLRKPSAPLEDEAKHHHHRDKKLFALRKAPNKHHEGDRRRWRDAITVRERKRYEGVWAANRGIHMSYGTEDLHSQTAMDNVQSCVSNLVVKDIWSRSRLPDNVLEEVWDLVDRKAAGKLERDEFVVGMWLVDQRLKGRKLPVRVGDSVWRSARGVYGLKLPRLKD